MVWLGVSDLSACLSQQILAAEEERPQLMTDEMSGYLDVGFLVTGEPEEGPVCPMIPASGSSSFAVA